MASSVMFQVCTLQLFGMTQIICFEHAANKPAVTVGTGGLENTHKIKTIKCSETIHTMSLSFGPISKKFSEASDPFMRAHI